MLFILICYLLQILFFGSFNFYFMGFKPITILIINFFSNMCQLFNFLVKTWHFLMGCVLQRKLCLSPHSFYLMQLKEEIIYFCSSFVLLTYIEPVNNWKLNFFFSYILLRKSCNNYLIFSICLGTHKAFYRKYLLYFSK